MPKSKPKPKAKKKTKGKEEYGGTLSYEFSPEADKALENLKGELGGSRTQLINEAVIQMALANGIKVKGRKKTATLEGIDNVVNALCGYALKSECESDDFDELRSLIQKAVDSDTKKEPTALWKAVKDEVPECVWGKELFQIFLKVDGIPQKTK